MEIIQNYHDMLGHFSSRYLSIERKRIELDCENEQMNRRHRWIYGGWVPRSIASLNRPLLMKVDLS